MSDYVLDLSCVDDITDDDLRQDCVVALLERHPETAEAVRKIIQRTIWSKMRQHERERIRSVAIRDALRIAHGVDRSGGMVADPTPLTDAVLRLPHKLRTVMIMRFLLDCTVVEVAIEMGVAAPTVERWTRTAKNLLRSMMP